MAPLRRLFRIVNGGTPTADAGNWDGGIGWATPIDLAAVNGGVLGETKRTLSLAGLGKGSRSVPPGSLILSTRAPIGYVAQTSAETAFNQGCRGLVPSVPMDIRFFRYQLTSQTASLNMLGQGSTFVELAPDDLGSYRLSVPPTREQRAIADFLDAENTRIDVLTAKKRRLRCIIRERIEAFTREWLHGLAAAYGEVALRRWVMRVEQGWSPICDDRPAQVNEWGVLKTSAVSSGKFKSAENKRLPDNVEPQLRWAVADGDLLLTRGSGSASSVGQAAVARTDGRKLTISDLIYRVRLSEADSDFVAAVLQSPQVRRQIEGSIRTDAGQTLKLRGEDVLGLMIPAVPSHEQRRTLEGLSKRITPSHDVDVALDRQIGLLQVRRQALITAAVTGELDLAETG